MIYLLPSLLILLYCAYKRNFEIAFLGSAITAIFALFLVAITTELEEPISIVVNEEYLGAIRIKDGLHGSLFLGSGSIDSSQYYFYYVKNSDGSLSPRKIAAYGNVAIYQEDRNDAFLRVIGCDGKRDFLHYIFTIPSWVHCNTPYVYEFHVPIGTVKIDFEM